MSSRTLQVQAFQILAQRSAQVWALEGKFYRGFQKSQLVAGIVSFAVEYVAVDFFFLQQLLQSVGELQFAAGAGFDLDKVSKTVGVRM